MKNEQQSIVTDTPRTNKVAIEINKPNPEGHDRIDWISFARQLERELNQKQLDAYKAGMSEAELNARESKTLEEAIERIASTCDKKETI